MGPREVNPPDGQEEAPQIGAHSLSAGFLTNQIDNSTPAPVIMQMSGHKCERVLNGYYRKARLFDRNLTAIAGL